MKLLATTTVLGADVSHSDVPAHPGQLDATGTVADSATLPAFGDVLAGASSGRGSGKPETADAGKPRAHKTDDSRSTGDTPADTTPSAAALAQTPTLPTVFAPSQTLVILPQIVVTLPQTVAATSPSGFNVATSGKVSTSIEGSPVAAARLLPEAQPSSAIVVGPAMLSGKGLDASYQAVPDVGLQAAGPATEAASQLHAAVSSQGIAGVSVTTAQVAAANSMVAQPVVNRDSAAAQGGPAQPPAHWLELGDMRSAGASPSHAGERDRSMSGISIRDVTSWTLAVAPEQRTTTAAPAGPDIPFAVRGPSQSRDATAAAEAVPDVPLAAGGPNQSSRVVTPGASAGSGIDDSPVLPVGASTAGSRQAAVFDPSPAEPTAIAGFVLPGNVMSDERVPANAVHGQRTDFGELGRDVPAIQVASGGLAAPVLQKPAGSSLVQDSPGQATLSVGANMPQQHVLSQIGTTKVAPAPVALPAAEPSDGGSIARLGAVKSAPVAPVDRGVAAPATVAARAASNVMLVEAPPASRSSTPERREGSSTTGAGETMVGQHVDESATAQPGHPAGAEAWPSNAWASAGASEAPARQSMVETLLTGIGGRARDGGDVPAGSDATSPVVTDELEGRGAAVERIATSAERVAGALAAGSPVAVVELEGRGAAVERMATSAERAAGALAAGSPVAVVELEGRGAAVERMATSAERVAGALAAGSKVDAHVLSRTESHSLPVRASESAGVSVATFDGANRGGKADPSSEAATRQATNQPASETGSNRGLDRAERRQASRAAGPESVVPRSGRTGRDIGAVSRAPATARAASPVETPRRVTARVSGAAAHEVAARLSNGGGRQEEAGLQEAAVGTTRAPGTASFQSDSAGQTSGAKSDAHDQDTGGQNGGRKEHSSAGTRATEAGRATQAAAVTETPHAAGTGEARTARSIARGDTLDSRASFRPIVEGVVVRHAALRVAGSSSSFRVVLEPKLLGQVIVNVVKGLDGLQVSLTAQRDDTGTLLHSHVSELVASLNASNIGTVHATVVARDNPSSTSKSVPTAGHAAESRTTTGRQGSSAFNGQGQSGGQQPDGDRAFRAQGRPGRDREVPGVAPRPRPGARIVSTTRIDLQA